jgi:hypothetical protein
MKSIARYARVKTGRKPLAEIVYKKSCHELRAFDHSIMGMTDEFRDNSAAFLLGSSLPYCRYLLSFCELGLAYNLNLALRNRGGEVSR